MKRWIFVSERIVNAGEIIASGTPDEILSHEQVRKVYLGEKFRL
jgi:lipopolysaccharide export system ATP-binding protein